MRLLERIFGPRIDEDPAKEAQVERDIEKIAVKHKATLKAVDALLSDSQRIAIAVDETGDAIRRARRRRHK